MLTTQLLKHRYRRMTPRSIPLSWLLMRQRDFVCFHTLRLVKEAFMNQVLRLQAAARNHGRGRGSPRGEIKHQTRDKLRRLYIKEEYLNRITSLLY